MRRARTALAVLLVAVPASALIQAASASRSSDATVVEHAQPILTVEEKAAILRHAYAVFDELVGLGDSMDSSGSLLSRLEVPYDFVFVSAYHPNGKLLGCQGTEQSSDGSGQLAADLRKAVENLRQDQRFPPSPPTAELAQARLVVTLLHGRRPIKLWFKTAKMLDAHIEPGVHAIRLDRGRRRAIFLDGVPITKNYSLRQTLQRLAKKAGVGPYGYAIPGSRLSVYETITFTGDRAGQVAELYRYRTPLSTEALSAELVAQRIDLAGQWFLQNIHAGTGLLEYQYDPARDRYTRSDNHVRRLASLWSIARLANFSKDHARYRPLITRTFNHYLAFLLADGRGGAHLKVEGRAGIANGAFVLLGLCEWGEHPEREVLIRMLADGIIHQQRADGAYRTFVGKGDVRKGIDFYPGEAMLALLNAYRVLREPAYLASVERAVPFYRDYWRKHPNTAFVPWHSQVHLLLYQETRKPEYAAFAFEMNDWILAKHQLLEPRYPDELGGFGVGRRRKPRNSTSSYLEGLSAAYHLAVLAQDPEHAERYAKAIRLGSRFILQGQVTAASAFYLPNAARAIGGFPQSLTRLFQRNDYTQHAVMALMKAYENGLFEPVPTS